MCYLPERRKQLKPLSVLLTGNGTSLACAGYLIFEQDLNSLYEKGELNLAVDCKGNVLTWEIEFGFHIIKSFAMRQRSRRDTFNRKKPEDEIEIRVIYPQHQTYMVKNASACTGKKQILK